MSNVDEGPDIVRDLIYLDFEKLASIFSQMSGGLLERTEATTEASRDVRNIRAYDLKLFKPEFGGISAERTSQVESRLLHHDLLKKVEGILVDGGFAVDLTSRFPVPPESAEEIRTVLGEASYLKAEGWSSFEDFGRFASVAQELNQLTTFIHRCAKKSVEDSDAVRQIRSQVAEAREAAEREKDRNARARILAPVRALEHKLESLLDTQPESVPDWLIDGLRHFIETLMPDRLNVRLYPFQNVPEFEVIANLKRDCFVDADIENLHFAYGQKPNVPLTIFGLVTSLPRLSRHPIEEIRTALDRQAKDNDVQALAKGFRGAFDGLEGLERFVRFSRYPGLTIYPLALYRTIVPVE